MLNAVDDWLTKEGVYGMVRQGGGRRKIVGSSRILNVKEVYGHSETY
jgi:hypothetical protein